MSNRIGRWSTVGLLSVLSVAAIAGCKEDETPSAGQGTPASPTVKSDAEITGVLQAANAGEISEAMVAVAQGHDPTVVAFANRMITDHTAAEKQQADLVKITGVGTVESDVSAELQAGTTTTLANLHGLTGAAFDRAYINAQVSDHQHVLDLINTQLIPTAKNADIRAFVLTLRPIVEQHLALAKQISASLATPVTP